MLTINHIGENRKSLFRVALHPLGYWWRIVKLSVILSFLPQSSSSIFEFATSIRKDGEPVIFAG